MKNSFAWIKRDLQFSDRLVWIAVALPFAFYLVMFGIYIKDEYKEKKRAEQYSYNCSLNKGIAVRDLEGKMRCVPMFAAIRKGQP